MQQVVTRRYPGLPSDVRYIVQPDTSDVNDPMLRALHARWLFGKAAASGLVSRTIIETPEMYPLLRNVMLLEIERPTPFKFDYIYRIYGADIAANYGQDMTGKRTSDFPGPVSNLFLDLYEKSIKSLSPIYSEHEPPLNVDVKLWRRLILPLGVDAVEWLLVVNLSAGPRRWCRVVGGNSLAALSEQVIVGLVRRRGQGWLVGLAEPRSPIH